jgi:4-hydroxy-tetrahydrodipicolinate reductase
MRLVVAGAGGRWARAGQGSTDSGLALAGALEDARSPLIGWDSGTLAGLPENGIKLAGDARRCWLEG